MYINGTQQMCQSISTAISREWKEHWTETEGGSERNEYGLNANK